MTSIEKSSPAIPTAQPIIFVTGTDTDVGKTFISTLLAHKWRANYWKPLQTGIESDDGDSVTVKTAKCDASWMPEIFQPRYEMIKPLSPYKAMDYEPSIDIQLTDFEIPKGSEKAPLIVEGAGGAFVPITKDLKTMTDLMKHLAITNTHRPFKIIVVARSGLGTLNHTLLTINYLENEGLSEHILGIVVNGEKNQGNVEVLRDYGLEILAEVETTSSPASALNFIPPLNGLL